MSLFPTTPIQSGRKFLVKNTDMRLSFETLTDLAEKKVGANFEDGDIVYFENAKVTLRKALVQRRGVIIMVYWKKMEGKFIEVYASDGLLKEYIDFFE